MDPAVSDFLKDFAQALSSKRSYEIGSYVERGWRDMSKRFFSERPWPPASAVAGAVKAESGGFLAIYKVLAAKHALGVAGPNADRSALLRLHVESWEAFKDFFAAAEAGEVELPANAIFDTLNDFVYQFTTFHELKDAATGANRDAEEGEVLEGETEEATEARRAAEAAAAAAAAVPLSIEGVDDAALAAAWSLPSVMTLLHSLVDRSDLPSALASLPSGVHPQGFRLLSGYFAAVVLCRLHAKTGDYAAAIEVVRPLNLLAGEGLFVRIPRCHITLPYYAGFALMMARRFDEALRLLSRTLLFFQRTGRILDPEPQGEGGQRPGGPSAYMRRQADKMLQLLAICLTVLPSAPGVDEPVRKAVRERYGDRMERIAAGVGAEDVIATFEAACPGFIPLIAPASTASPTPAEAAAAAAAGGSDVTASAAHMFKAHLALFGSEVSQRSACGMSSLRSYLRLYTNTRLGQLGEYCKASPEDVRALLTSIKIKSTAGVTSGPTLVPDASVAASANASSSAASAAGGGVAASGGDPIHFYLTSDTVSIDEARQAFYAGGFFLRGIENMSRIIHAKEPSAAAQQAAAGQQPGTPNPAAAPYYPQQQQRQGGGGYQGGGGPGGAPRQQGGGPGGYQGGGGGGGHQGGYNRR